MEDIKLRITGTRPVLFHNAAELVNPFSAATKAKKVLTSKRTNKTEDDLIEIARLEWAASWYWGTDGPELPAACLIASFTNAAKQTRHGKMMERGVNVGFTAAPLSYVGPRTLDGLWGKGLEGSAFVDYRPVGQQAVKVMRCRPILQPGWSVDTTWYVDTATMDLELFLDVAQRAGRTEGVGDFRKIFGRYEVTVL